MTTLGKNPCTMGYGHENLSVIAFLAPQRQRFLFKHLLTYWEGGEGGTKIVILYLHLGIDILNNNNILQIFYSTPYFSLVVMARHSPSLHLNPSIQTPRFPCKSYEDVSSGLIQVLLIQLIILKHYIRCCCSPRSCRARGWAGSACRTCHRREPPAAPGPGDTRGRGSRAGG